MATKHKINKDGKKPAKAMCRPEYAGEQNMDNAKIATMNSVTVGDNNKINMLSSMIDMKRARMQCMAENRQNNVSRWDIDSLSNSLNKFFSWCVENVTTPSPPLLALWLNVDRTTLTNWKKADDFRGDLINEAFLVMEALYFDDLDKRPVPNMFRLKSSFGYVEASRLDVKHNDGIDEVDIKEVVQNLGILKITD